MYGLFVAHLPEILRVTEIVMILRCVKTAVSLAHMGMGYSYSWTNACQGVCNCSTIIFIIYTFLYNQYLPQSSLIPILKLILFLLYSVFEERPSIVQSDNPKSMSVGPSSPASDPPTTPSESTDASDQHSVQSSLQQSLQMKTSHSIESRSKVMFIRSRSEQLEDSLHSDSVNT